jgi:hypothetical protein
VSSSKNPFTSSSAEVPSSTDMTEVLRPRAWVVSWVSGCRGVYVADLTDCGGCGSGCYEEVMVAGFFVGGY